MKRQKVQAIKDVLRAIILLGLLGGMGWGVTVLGAWMLLLQVTGVVVGGFALILFLCWVFEDEPEELR